VTSGTRSTGWLLAVAVTSLLLTAGCGSAGPSGAYSGGADGTGTLLIASDRTAESQVMGQLYSQLLTAAGKHVQLEPGYASPADTVKAVTAGKVSLAPAYEGILLRTLSGAQHVNGDMATTLSMALPPGITALEPASAQRADVLVVTRATAERHKLHSLADLKKIKPRLVFGGAPATDPELTSLTDLQTGYDFAFGSVRSLDAAGSASRAALTDGKADVVALLGTDPAIARNHWVVLADPKHLMQSDHVIPLISAPYADLTTRTALAKLNDALTTKELATLATAKDPAQAASDWLEARKLVR
jgi:osmoprotectant transport system substrate-binding protein